MCSCFSRCLSFFSDLQSNRPLFLGLPLLKPCCNKGYLILLKRCRTFHCWCFFISLYGFHQVTIFQSLYTIKVQFKNEPKRSKDNNQSKHLLAKQSISMIKNTGARATFNTDFGFNSNYCNKHK